MFQPLPRTHSLNSSSNTFAYDLNLLLNGCRVIPKALVPLEVFVWPLILLPLCCSCLFVDVLCLCTSSFQKPLCFVRSNSCYVFTACHVDSTVNFIWMVLINFLSNSIATYLVLQTSINFQWINAKASTYLSQWWAFLVTGDGLSCNHYINCLDARRVSVIDRSLRSKFTVPIFILTSTNTFCYFWAHNFNWFLHLWTLNSAW